MNMGPPFCVTLWTIPLLLTAVCAMGNSCEDHPGYNSAIQPVLVKSWDVITGSTFSQSNYHPRFQDLRYAPISNMQSTKYANLDLFWASGGDEEGDRHMRVNLQRAAKVYLLVSPEWDSSLPVATLTGWKSEGYAERVVGEDIVYGVHQKLERWAPSRVYVFSRRVRGSFFLPNERWIEQNTKGIKTGGNWLALIAEADGSASAVPRNPTGVDDAILPNKKCPDSLHDLWVTRNTDKDDADTKGKMWRTCHPMWDPCYWCAYDHEHGSCPKHLMNYEPKFGYVAWKNNREVESHAGFKGVAFKYGEFLIYYCLHAQTSKLRRVSERHHSIILVVVDARTKELLVELQHKAFYGALMTRKKGGGFIALSTEEERIVRQLEEDNHSRNKRSVNVIDVKNLHPAYEYNMPLSSIIHGRYEEWTTGPICTARGHRGMITVDFRNPITGIKSARQRTVPVNLGSYYGDTFLRHDGSARRFVMREFELSEDDCVFKLKNILGGMSIDGSFYTDAYGVNIVATSGTIHVKQYMKRGFKMKVDGHFEPVDVWNGLFEKDAGNRRSSYGFGLDPEVN